MPTITEATIPVDNFALSETLQRGSDATIECEQIVEHPDNTVIPLVWVRNTNSDAFEATLDQDSTVETYTQLAGTDTELLYEMDWSANIQLVLRILTTEGAVILDAVGSAAGWDLRVLFPDHDDVRDTHNFCEAHNITVTIRNIRHLDNEDSRQESVRAGLTADQHEALTAVYNRGYFEVPRAVELEDVADDIGVSHQALSERLRRGHETLIGETLLVGTDPATADHQPAGGVDRSDDEEAPPGAD